MLEIPQFEQEILILRINFQSLVQQFASLLWLFIPIQTLDLGDVGVNKVEIDFKNLPHESLHLTIVRYIASQMIVNLIEARFFL
jgi:hypothetical protein